MSILSTVMDALKKDKTLTGMLAHKEKSIYHILSPDAGTYPVLVVSVIGDVPALVADDAEKQCRQTIRIHILTKDGGCSSIASRITIIMLSLGAMRKQTFEHVEGKIFVRTLDYTMVGEM